MAAYNAPSMDEWHRFKISQYEPVPMVVTAICRGVSRQRIIKHPMVPAGYRPVVEGESLEAGDIYLSASKVWESLPRAAVGVIVGQRATIYFAREIKEGEENETVYCQKPK